MKGMIRVIAVGNGGGNIVDCLREKEDFKDVEFWYCDSDKADLMGHGQDTDRHILFGRDFHIKYIDDIHVENEFVAIVVACLGGQMTSTYLYDIVGESWGFADKVYCFVTLPIRFDMERRNKAIEIFHNITDWSDITILQDNAELPENTQQNDGMAQLLTCCLRNPKNGTSEDRELFTTAELVTVKRMWVILNSYVVNRMPEWFEAATFSFHKRGKEKCRY